MDILSPIGNCPRLFGQCAAANALSDIYAMGGTAYSAMNIIAFAACDFPLFVVQDILRGAADKIAEAGAVLAGGHTLEDPNLKFGLSVTGIVDKNHFARNSALEVSDQLILTKPLGTGILSTGIKAKWEDYEEAEKTMYRWTTHLNKNASSLISSMKLLAATDITGFGLGGHALEMAEASQKTIRIFTKDVPLMDFAMEYAQSGLIPQGSYTNFAFAKNRVKLAPLNSLGSDSAHRNSKSNKDELSVEEQSDAFDLLVRFLFDPQTSGGLLLAVPKEKAHEAQKRLHELGELAIIIGEVAKLENPSQYLIIE